MNSSADTVLKDAVKEGLAALKKIKSNLEDTFRAAFVGYVNNNGGTTIRAQLTTVQEEAQTGSDVILFWTRGQQQISCYLQLKLLYPSYQHYVKHLQNAWAIADKGVRTSWDNMPQFLGSEQNKWSSDGRWFQVLYRSTLASPYNRHLQVMRMGRTVDTKNLHHDIPVAAGGFMLIDSDKSNVVVLPLKAFSDNEVYLNEESLGKLRGLEVVEHTATDAVGSSGFVVAK